MAPPPASPDGVVLAPALRPGGEGEANVDDDAVTVRAYPNGPLVVRGPARILDEHGEPLPRARRTVALCRCGLSSRAPLCDGTHKVGTVRRPAADAG